MMRSIGIAMLGSVLVACGGLVTSDETQARIAGNLQTGRLVQPVVVAGLRYESASHSGVTGSDGSFRYRAGETITFRLGNVLFGRAGGQAELSWADLGSEITLPTTTTEALHALRDDNFKHWVHTLVFLHTFDEDDNPYNGIQLSDAMNELFEGASINFDQTFGDFQRDPTLHAYLGAANAQGLFNSQRTMPGTAAVLNQTYALNGFSTKPFFAISEQTIDRNTNGVFQIYSAAHYTYDEHGYPKSRIRGNGTQITWREYFTHDERGLRTDYHRDRDGDTDGSIAPDLLESVQIDVHGRMTRRERDKNDDGSPDQIETFAYDIAGNVREIKDDRDGDGSWDTITAMVFNAQKQKTRHEVDSDANGNIDSIESFSYDSEGRKLLHEEDENADGTIETSKVFIYDMAGRLIREEVYELGTLTRIVHTRYNALGQRIRVERDPNADGIIDEIFTYAYDNLGNETLKTYDSDANGNTDWTERNIYDTQGRQVLYEYDSNGDGTVDLSETWEYNAAGQQIRHTEIDGSDVFETLFYYDPYGNRVRIDKDTNADGTFNQITTQSFISVGWGWVLQFVQ